MPCERLTKKSGYRRAFQHALRYDAFTRIRAAFNAVLRPFATIRQQPRDLEFRAIWRFTEHLLANMEAMHGDQIFLDEFLGVRMLDHSHHHRLGAGLE